MKFAKHFSFPDSYKAAVLNAAKSPLEIINKQFDGLDKNEVWVHVKASPINPSDLAMLVGTYPHKKKYPFVPGLEASGVVVASGGGFMANYFLGKRVACSPSEVGDGAWAEYIKVPASNCIPLSKTLTFEQGATALVNPLTAIILHKKAKANGRAYVNTAAAGALGKMLITLAAKQNITTINIVRKPEQVDNVQKIGGKIVIDLSQKDFEERYKNACAENNPQTILDAIGGSFSDILLQNAPEKTTLIAYASLSKENIVIAPQTIIRGGKVIEGFHLGTWLQHQPLHKKVVLTRRAQKLIASGVLHTHIYQKFDLSKMNEAVAGYQENMSLGKWILTT